jgi:hypothetical protein
VTNAILLYFSPPTRLLQSRRLPHRAEHQGARAVSVSDVLRVGLDSTNETPRCPTFATADHRRLDPALAAWTPKIRPRSAGRNATHCATSRCRSRRRAGCKRDSLRAATNSFSLQRRLKSSMDSRGAQKLARPFVHAAIVNARLVHVLHCRLIPGALQGRLVGLP